MKRFLFLTAFAVIFSFVTASEDLPIENPNLNAAVVEPYILEGFINETLTNLSILLQSYDPYIIPEADYKVTSTYVRAELLAKNVYLSGFSKFSATDLHNKVTIIPPGVKSTFKLKFEELQLIVPDYFVDALAVFVPFYGKGFLNLNVREIHGGAFAQILTTTQGLRLRNLELHLNISQTNLTISGVLNNEPLSQIISTSTTECFAEFVNLYNDRLGKLLGARLVPVINNILHPKPKGLLDDLEETYDMDSENLEGDDGRDTSSADEGESFELGPYKFKIKIVT